MTDRDISGDATRSRFKAAQKLAGDLGLSPAAMDTIAEGVREFDALRAPEVRAAKALERIADKVGPEKHSADYEAARLRRREVYAQELMAVALYEDDPESEAMVGIRGSAAYKRLVARLAGQDAPGT